MKIATITDLHFAIKRHPELYHKYYSRFYDNIFFPYLRKHNIKDIICLGDVFDNRKSIDYNSLAWAKDNFFGLCDKNKINLKIITGNHDIHFKNTNKINSPNLLLREYPQIQVYEEICDVIYDDLKVTLCPWINPENQEDTLAHINETNSHVLFGHLEINGFESHHGHYYSGGLSQDTFSKFKKVFSGHFHSKSTQKNITYLGNPYHLYWGDYGEERGFHIFDTKTFSLDFIKNPYTLFHKINYEDSLDIETIDYSKFEDCFIKVYVNSKYDDIKFSQFIEKINDSKITDLKIEEMETYEKENEIEDIFEKGDDTKSLIDYYISCIDYPEQESLNNIVTNLYIKSLEVV